MAALGQRRRASSAARCATRLLGQPVDRHRYRDAADAGRSDQAPAKPPDLKAVPTGIEHGTVTAVANGKPFEITTLRRDVETDGRRAVVAFSDDWAEDAQRRDFTMNALYASTDGEVFDTVGGVADLQAGRVRFVGDAGDAHPRGLSAHPAPVPLPRLVRQGRDRQRCAACCGRGKSRPGAAFRRARAEGNARAARSRRPDAGPARDGGDRNSRRMLPGDVDCPAPGTAGRRSTPTISSRPIRCCVSRRCCPMPRPRANVAEASSSRMRRSRAPRRYRERARRRSSPICRSRKCASCSIGLVRERFKDRVFLKWAEDPKDSNAIQWRALLALADAWERPKFPLTGREVMRAGVPRRPADRAHPRRSRGMVDR